MACLLRLSSVSGSAVGACVLRTAAARSRSSLVTRCIFSIQRKSKSSDARESWDDMLEKRRRDRIEGTAASRGTNELPREELQDVVASSEMDAATRAELERDALQLQLFAYPSHRAVPWATMCLIVASGSLTAGLAMYWNRNVCSSLSVDELRSRVQSFTRILQACTVNREGLANGEAHRLIFASLIQAGSAPSRVITDSCIFVCCGTLFERLHGSSVLLAFMIATTVTSNILSLLAQERYVSRGRQTSIRSDANSPVASGNDVFITSTSGGIVALGVFCGIRYSRWAVWPGLPIPVTWLLAPLLVADVIAGRDYLRQLVDYRTVMSDPDYEIREASNLHDVYKSDRLTLAVCLGACEGVAERSRSECRPALDDVEIWQGQLEHAAESLPPLPPDGAFWADVFGAVSGLMLAVLARGRL